MKDSLEQLDEIIEQHNNDMASLEAFTVQQTSLFQQGLHDRNTLRGLQLLSQEHGIETAGLEDLQSFMRSVSETIARKAAAFGEQIAIWFDRSGRKELQRLERHYHEKAGGPVSRTIADRPLADALSIEGNVISHHNGHMDQLVTYMHSLTDKYLPAVMERDRRLWDVVEKSGYVPDQNNEALVPMLQKLIHEIAAQGNPATVIANGGVHRFAGNRFVIGERLQARIPVKHSKMIDADVRALQSLVANEKRALATQEQARNGQGVSRVGVVPVLDRAGFEEVLGVMGRLIDEIERTAAIMRDSRGHKIVRHMDTLFTYATQTESYDVLDEDGDVSDTIEVTGIDSDDAARINLISQFLNMDVFHVARILKLQTVLCAGLWKTYLKYARASLKFYA